VLGQLLKEGRTAIIDGAFGTEVEARGVDLSTDSLWSAKLLNENPDLIVEVHKDYFQAGADIVITSSYQATVEDFMKKGFSEQEATNLIARSVHLGR
jgi:homocysteine S-methyltransferase